jgi:uncharacterized protein YndB with AHSA1/START domain
MPTARRNRLIAADLETVWGVVEDPHHMPRWWPGVARMEGVSEDRFTQVFTTKKGRPVRVDFRLLESAPPGSHGDELGRRSWEQEILGTPFERLLNQSITEIELKPADGGTLVKIELRQKLRGYSKFGGFMLRRATKARLDEALAGLESICA